MNLIYQVIFMVIEKRCDENAEFKFLLSFIVTKKHQLGWHNDAD